LKKPSLRLAIEINKRVREKDEWFEEPDDLERLSRALTSVDCEENPVVAAGILAYRVTRAQGFAEGKQHCFSPDGSWTTMALTETGFSRVTTSYWQIC
jgi:hypothetical protein